jgi:ribose 1,5-bisphosphate isomerase
VSGERREMVIPETVARVADDIRSMRIRGASRIAMAGLEALKNAADEIYMESESPRTFLNRVREAEKVLLDTRPTAVALPNALSFLDNSLNSGVRNGVPREELRKILDKSVSQFIERVGEASKRIADLAMPLIPGNSTAITHCHSSAAVIVMRKAAAAGLLRAIYVTETRPLYQGRITAKELENSGASIRFITDSAAGFYMKDSDVMIVGADAVAMNGDLVNKIGTFQMAALAKQLNKKVLVAAETYKIATRALTGADVPIEFRSSEEVYGQDPAEVGNPEILNPAFDVTPAELIDFIVTEIGVITEPEREVPTMAKKAGLLPGRQVF